MTLESPNPKLKNFIDISKEVENGLDSLLSHFNQEKLFPRTIQTYKTEGNPIKVYSKEEAISYFADSNYIDCKINAFPTFTEYKGVQIYPPDFIFIDIDNDRNIFKDDKSFEKALSKTLKNIKDKTIEGAIPTVNNSGNGVHVLLPIECPIFESIPEFEKYKIIFPSLNISQEFIRFAEKRWTNGKSDKGHYPSFKSSQIRVPNSINGKCLEDRAKRFSGNVKIKTIQHWNGVRAHISREFIEDFRTYLEQKIVDQELQAQQQQEKQSKSFTLQNSHSNNKIEWIENSLLIPIERPRRICVDLIFVPYFIMIKQLPEEEIISRISEWLDKCNSLRRLDFNPRQKINAAIKTTNKTQIPPMKKDTLKNNYHGLYQILKDKGAIE